MSKPTPAYIEVHVFGGETEGECIVLKMPDGSFGVVDSCLEKSADGERINPAIAFLQSRGVSTLAFLCLTHPHKDHYLGMLSLFQEFHPRQFWHPAAVSKKFLQNIIQRTKLPALEAGAFAAIDAADELQEIYFAVVKRLNDSKKKNGKPFQLVRVTMDLTKSEGHATIRAIAPHGNDVESFESQLATAFTSDGVLKSQLPAEEFNRISVALLVICKQFRILLGGDVENGSWKLIRRDCDEQDWRSRLYKVSHHGSSGAYCSELEAAVFLSDKGTEAVVTGYRKSSLPTQEVLEVIKTLSNSLAITHSRHLKPKSIANPDESRTALAEAFSLAVENTTESRTVLNAVFSLDAKRQSASVGQCSYYFNKRGELISSEVVSPACWVK